MKGQISNKVRVQHILDAIAEIEKYLANATIDEFLASSEKKFATIKQIEIIGEACDRITPEIKQTHAEIAWAPIKGFRNISIHEYFGVNFKIVWEIATNDLPVLKQQFNKILLELQ